MAKKQESKNLNLDWEQKTLIGSKLVGVLVVMRQLKTKVGKRVSILYLTSSSLGTRNVGYSIELPDLPPVFVWPFVHLIPYLVLIAFSQTFSVGAPHMGHLKSFIYFHLKPRKSQE
jgi:hypothetical protein